MGLTEGISKVTLLYMGCNVWSGLSSESRRLQVVLECNPFIAILVLLDSMEDMFSGVA
jgi:hypothetical protein